MKEPGLDNRRHHNKDGEISRKRETRMSRRCAKFMGAVCSWVCRHRQLSDVLQKAPADFSDTAKER